MITRSRVAFASGLLGLAVCLASLAGTGVAQAQAQAFTPDQRGEIETIIKDYLLRNPEVLAQAISELERRQQEQQKKSQQAAIEAMKATLASSPGSSIIGNPNGDVTLVEFFDYNCGYCKKALGDVRALIKTDPKLRVVLKDLPVLGPDSKEASRVALAVRQQISGDKLLEYHARLLETRGRVGGEQALKVARDMNLDMTRLGRDVAGPEVRLAMDDNEQLAQKLGINGTPAFIIGDEVIPGAVGADLLREAVSGMRKCGQAVCG